MKATSSEQDDQRYEQLLLKAEQMLAAGRTSVEECIPKNLEPKIAARLRRSVRCLKLVLEASPTRVESAEDTAVAIENGKFVRPPQFASSRWLDRFEVEQELGQGGMGIVYAAHDWSLNRKVALKVPRPEVITSQEVRLRFLREGQAAARLQHPAIATVFDAGEAGPICWIACELCEGISLAEWLARQSLATDPNDAALLLTELASALEHAHQRGVLHRDLKPGNVMLVNGRAGEAKRTSDDEPLSSLTPKLTDFGLAKILDFDGDKTRTGATVGTPSYMAPEQADPSHANVNSRTDVYGAGAILYHVLTGRSPFQAVTAADTYRKVLTEDPVPLRRIRADVPADLEAICLKCLEKDPRQRYESAVALADDLNRFLRGEPTRARPVGFVGQSVKWARRRPAVASLLTLLVVAVTVIIGGGSWQAAKNAQLVRDLTQRIEQDRQDRYVFDLKRAGQYWNEDKIPLMQQTLASYLPGDGERDLRDAAWYYLWRRCKTQLTTYEGNESEVAAVAYAPSGNVLATGGHDGTVRLFDTHSGDTIRVLHAVGMVTCVDFTPDEGLIASGTDQGEVILWDPVNGKQVGSLNGHQDEVVCLAITSDGQFLASGGRDNRICIWDLASHKLLRGFTAHDDWVRSLDFSQDDALLASGSDDRLVKLWDWRNEVLVHKYRIHKDWVTCVRFEPGGSVLASCSKDRSIRFYDIHAKEQVYSSLQVENWIRTIDYSPDGDFIAAAGNGHLVHLWKFDDAGEIGPQLVRSFQAHPEKVRALCFSPNEESFTTGSGDGSAKRWRVRDDRFADEIWTMPGGTGFVDVSASGETIVIADSERAILWDTIGSQVIGVHDRIDDLNHCRISPDGQWLGICSPKLGLRLLSVSGDTDHRVVDPGTMDIDCFDFHPTKKEIVASWGGGDLVFYDLQSGNRRNVTLTEREDARISSILVSPCGKTVAAYSYNGGELFIYDVENDKLKQTIEKCDGELSFSADGRLLAFAGTDRSIRVWNMNDLKEARVIPGETERLGGVALTPDGKLLASFASEGPIRLWSVDSGDEILEISRPIDCSNRDLLFAPDGSSLFVTGNRWYPNAYRGRGTRQASIHRYYFNSGRERSDGIYFDAPRLADSRVLSMGGRPVESAQLVKLSATTKDGIHGNETRWYLDIDPTCPINFGATYFRVPNLRLARNSAGCWQLAVTSDGSYLRYVAPKHSSEAKKFDGWYLAFVPHSHQSRKANGIELAYPLYLIDREAPPWIGTRDRDFCRFEFLPTLDRHDYLAREGWTVAIDPQILAEMSDPESWVDGVVLSESKIDRWQIEVTTSLKPR